MKAILYAKGNKRTIDNLNELRKNALHDNAPRVAQRIHGVMLSIEKYSVGDIATVLHQHRSTVHSWIILWNQHGINALFEGHRSGRPAQLTETDQEKLYDIIESGPVAYGLNTGVWTSPIISHVIYEEFNVKYHPGHVRKMIKNLGFSVQRPTTQLIRADKKAQNRWIRYTYPNFKKKQKMKML